MNQDYSKYSNRYCKGTAKESVMAHNVYIRVIKESVIESDSFRIEVLQDMPGAFHSRNDRMFNTSSTIEEYWSFIASCLSEEECEGLISYEIELEELFVRGA